MEFQELEVNADCEVLDKIEDYPLILRRKIGSGFIVYASAAVWNRATAGDEQYAANLLNIIEDMYPHLRAVQADIHVDYAIGQDGRQYLYIGNETGQSHAKISVSGKWERVLGTGDIQYVADGICIIEPDNLLLCEKRS
jgi:hypothetical protein